MKTEDNSLFDAEMLQDITPTPRKETKRKYNKKEIKRSTITITCTPAEKKKIWKAAIEVEETIGKYVLRKALQ